VRGFVGNMCVVTVHLYDMNGVCTALGKINLIG